MEKLTPRKNVGLQATMDIFPLLLAMTPWGILCGTLAIEAGLSVWQAQLMSLIMFAGAVQLSVIGLIGVGAPVSTMLNSTVMISSRHLLYSAAFEKEIRALSFAKRMLFAFVLTDEMFAVTHAYREKYGVFNYRYAVVAGILNYLVWNVSTFIGIAFAEAIDNIDELGLDFAIAAIFIAMTIPRIKGMALVIAVCLSGGLSVWFELIHFQHGLMIAGLVGMAVGYILTERGVHWRKKWKS